MLRFWPSLLSGLLFFKETRGFTSLNGECLSSSPEQVPHASLTGEGLWYLPMCFVCDGQLWFAAFPKAENELVRVVVFSVGSCPFKGCP